MLDSRVCGKIILEWILTKIRWDEADWIYFQYRDKLLAFEKGVKRKLSGSLKCGKPVN